MELYDLAAEALELTLRMRPAPGDPGAVAELRTVLELLLSLLVETEARHGCGDVETSAI